MDKNATPRLAIGLFLLLGFGQVTVQSQTTSTEILGLVTDSSGAVVPGAQVRITRLATGETRSALTNHAGEYIFRLIEIGEYTVRCEAQGFKIEAVTGLRVQIQQKARVDFTLQVGPVSDTVEVQAAAVALKTEDATVGEVIENKRIIELPLNGRNLNQLAVLVPGVQFGNRAGLNEGLGGFPPRSGLRSILSNTMGSCGIDGGRTLVILVDKRLSRPDASKLTFFL